MALSPGEHDTLTEIAARLMASDPYLGRRLRHGPGAASRREVLAWRVLAAVLFVLAYAVTEWGLMSAGLAVAADGALLAVLALCALIWAGHRTHCVSRTQE